MRQSLLLALQALIARAPWHFVGSIDELRAALIEAGPEGVKLPAERSLLKEIAAIGAETLHARGLVVHGAYRAFEPVIVVRDPSIPLNEVIPNHFADSEELVARIPLFDGSFAVARLFSNDDGGRGLSIEHVDAAGRPVEFSGLPVPTLPIATWRRLLPQIQAVLGDEVATASPSANTGGKEAKKAATTSA